MSEEAMLPCFKCGRVMRNVFVEADNQPDGGTEFRTYGHYGSTFWDSFDGEEIVINICDECLRAHVERVAQHKRYLPIRCAGMTGFGQYWVERPMVPFTGYTDPTVLDVEVEDLGSADLKHAEWVPDIAERKQWLEGE